MSATVMAVMLAGDEEEGAHLGWKRQGLTTRRPACVLLGLGASLFC
jgi:hypothetical protein